MNPGLKDTPRRVAHAWKEMLSGLDTDPEEVLGTVFEESYDQIVALRGIEFYSICEHHLLPFHGVAHVAYIPGLVGDGPKRRVVGISKLVRLVDCYARRLQLQERLTAQVAEALHKHLEPQGVAVVLEARHMCMACRGVRQGNTEMVTSKLLGAFFDSHTARMEALELLTRRRR